MKDLLARVAGRLLQGVRAGDAYLAIHHPALQGVPRSIDLQSDWFVEGGTIPRKAAGRGVGDNVSPPLRWSGQPKETGGYLLVMQDPDAPLPRPFVHLVSFGIPCSRCSLSAGELAETGGIGAPFGSNTNGARGYQGPRALPAHGPHRYIFQLIALDRPPPLEASKRLRGTVDACAGNAVAYGSLTGLFERK